MKCDICDLKEKNAANVINVEISLRGVQRVGNMQGFTIMKKNRSAVWGMSQIIKNKKIKWLKDA